MCGGRGHTSTHMVQSLKLFNTRNAKRASWVGLLDLDMGTFQVFQHSSQSLNLTAFGECKSNRCIRLRDSNCLPNTTCST